MFTRFARLAVIPLLLGVLALGYLNHQLRTAESTAAPAVSGPPVVYDTAATEHAFAAIYDKGTWAKRTDGAGTSGVGSTAHATLLYRTYLQQFLAEHDIHSVVDAGCGDWEFSQSIDWTGIDYKGYDIVPSVVEQDVKRFGKPNIQFFTADIVTTDLPPADLLISKHVLQHLPTAAVQQFLLQARKYKHVLLVDGVDRVTLTGTNTDIAPGQYRTLDVTQPPFSVPGARELTYYDGHLMHQVVHIVPPRP